MSQPAFSFGADKLYVKLDKAAMLELRSGPDSAAGKFLGQLAIQLEGAIKKDLSQLGTGRSYRRTKAGLYHIASAPGSPPATDSGRLRSSITHEIGRDVDGLVARVGTNVKYAVYLEFGTRKMAARPFMRVNLAKLERSHKQIKVGKSGREDLL